METLGAIMIPLMAVIGIVWWGLVTFFKPKRTCKHCAYHYCGKCFNTICFYYLEEVKGKRRCPHYRGYV